MEERLLQNISTKFKIENQQKKRKNCIAFSIHKSNTVDVLSYMKTSLSFDMLNMIACTDWIEEGEFEISYVLWAYDKKLQAIIKTRVDRENPSMNTITALWEQAETFEREIHEMYGVDFPGNNRLVEFMLEDWKFMPPLRRDFDTQKFVENEYDMRSGRNDAKNVKEYMKKKRERKKQQKQE